MERILAWAEISCSVSETGLETSARVEIQKNFI